MPKVRVDQLAIVVARPSVHVVYQPGERLAPDAHIEEIVRQGKGERLTSRGDEFRTEPQVDASEPSAETPQ